MTRADKIKMYVKIIQDNRQRLSNISDLIEINRGKLLPYIIDALYKQLSKQSADIAKGRVPPINVLKRIIKKMTKLYAKGAMRAVEGGNDKDSDLLSELSKTIEPDMLFAKVNMYVNLAKYCLIQAFLSAEGKPRARVIQPDQFIPLSNNLIEPEKPTGYLILVTDDHKMSATSAAKCQVWMYSDNYELIFFTTKGDDVTDDYSDSDGVNDMGFLPLVYVNQEDEELIPTEDTDSFQMSVLIPLIMTDINFAHMFQAFSQIYTIDCDDDELISQPNSIWRFRSDPKNERAPQIGTIDNQADISGGINLVANQFAMWLNTKGIKPGEVGEINGSNFSSGMSKMMDELDTSESIEEQIPIMSKAESETWDLILKKMLSHWNTRTTRVYKGPRGLFTATASVKTIYTEQLPFMRRKQVLEESITELGAKLTTRRNVIKRLHPKLTENEVDAFEADLDLEYPSAAPATPPPVEEEIDA